MIDKLLSRIKKALGIHQPSKMMEDKAKAKLFKDSFAAGMDYVDE